MAPAKVGALVGVRSLLVEEILDYLDKLAERRAVLPRYFPAHLQVEEVLTAELWQITRAFCERYGAKTPDEGS